MQKITYDQYTDREIEQLVNQTYANDGIKDFSVAACEECGNGVKLDYDLSIKEELDLGEKKELKEWLTGKRYNWVLYVILKDMIWRGIIPPGNILITVDW